MPYVILALAAAAADRVVKWLTFSLFEADLVLYGAVRVLPENCEITLVPGLLRLTYAENTGISFSMFNDPRFRWILIAISVACTAALLVVVLKYGGCRVGRFGAALALGGALGNLVDRVFAGYVIDMLEFIFVRFAIFNVADTFITVGMILFGISYLRKEKHDSGDHGGGN